MWPDKLLSGIVCRHTHHTDPTGPNPLPFAEPFAETSSSQAQSIVTRISSNRPSSQPIRLPPGRPPAQGRGRIRRTRRFQGRSTSTGRYQRQPSSGWRGNGQMSCTLGLSPPGRPYPTRLLCDPRRRRSQRRCPSVYENIEKRRWDRFNSQMRCSKVDNMFSMFFIRV